VVHRPVGTANVAKYCEALSTSSPSFQQVLRDMVALDLSIEQGLQRVSDTVVACAQQVPRASKNIRSRMAVQGKAVPPWFDAE
jgi:hypothetical protein